MVVGDFNLHHLLADTLCTLHHGEYRLSNPYFDRASEHCFSLLNQPCLYSNISFSHGAWPSLLDLSFDNELLSPSVVRWDTAVPSTRSDHVPILISFDSPRFRPPDPSPNWAKRDRSTILPTVPALVPPPLPSSCPASGFEKWFDTHLNRVHSLITSNTPLSRPFPRSKPWWSPLLSDLRAALHCAARTNKSYRDPYD